MRILSSFLVFLASTAAVAAEEVPSNAEPGAVSTTGSSLVTPPPLPPQSNQDEGALEAREIVQNPGAAPATTATQMNPTTTIWQETTLKDGEVVTAPVTYVQTFAKVPDQWPSPSSGSIGLGTLSGKIGVTSTITVEARSLKARSEGTLGQTPWIGMAVGLTCTALAAIMLG
ncbi:hypothetical protein VTN96DRAFT_5167 [Rasamsonia emersonii]|uniref:GPI anchored protein n=1 Tax=Rasamsonia emersonii (strain ATCC 16479 / CBS 393.64 / IMI 116815) TaxID=1408163 RepID=A0A0F4Z2B9_RASE3|nr:hypothetical protein T310_1914 [Rasamsonia emersonii CBS 393.64]KKA24033.1 hypothetical protein T310_1914 [Rasamsonia emersonii CBS 393.64]